MKKKILIIGVGTAGLLTLSHFCSSLPQNYEVHSVYDPKIPILGVGEATNTSAPFVLFKGTDFVPFKDADEIDALLKFSVKYTNWRSHTFSSIILPPSYAMHFDNTRLKDFVLPRLKQRYNDRFFTIEGTVEYFRNVNNGVEVKINDSIEIFDWVVDCGGFPKDYSNYEMVDLPLNHALVTRVHEPGTWDYTHHWAHKNGWMFGIPLKSKQGWGYLYNDEITSKEDALEDMSEILKLDKSSIEYKEYVFKPYYTTKNLVNGRILLNCNRYMFFEPMEALSMEFYTWLNNRYVDLIQNQLTEKKLKDDCNFEIKSLINFYRFIYHGGSNYNTEFWKTTQQKCSDYLLSDNTFKEMIRYWQSNCHNPNISTDMNLTPFRAYSWEKFDKELGYNYFVKPKSIQKTKIPGLLFG